MKTACPNCDYVWSIPKEYGGFPIKCPKCKADFQCPEPQPITGYILTCIVSGALAGIIGFGCGALLTRTSREEAEATITTIKAKADKEVEDAKKQIQALRKELRKLQSGESVTERYPTTSHKNTTDMDKYIRAQKEDKSTMAQIIAHDFIKTQLKSPSTADFPWFAHRISRSKDEDQVYTVISHVDSQNSFGAEIRTKFWIKLRYLGGEASDTRNWEIISWSTY